MTIDLESLLLRVRSTFPDLRFETARLAPQGEDHAVVILDEAWAFRFPRNAEQASWFQTEARLLSALAGGSALATPDYRFMAPDGDFGGYALIPGEEMTLGKFDGLPAADQEAILTQLAGFLSALHALPPDVLTRADGARRTNEDWDKAAVERYLAETRPALAAHAPPELTERLDQFHQAYLSRVWPCDTVVHGDLREAHLLMTPDGARLSGVIDFGDAVIGDPAYDFTFLWLLNEGAAAFVLERYTGAKDGILERSRWSFIRMATRRLARVLDGDPRYPAERLMAAVTRQLDAVGM